ncbi:hypothetical protein DFH08DRAFT_891337 [Mycena albidolilacea]|uniref:DUF6534 domain-containing protein n=1 Tax=Mycena albidolilacea TaxID=1033008 RepID=A0AAD7EFJ4_9AGAR|nr:hypothetical protein DFH08DRAFT_891337 [Mycena albidolilacea]
MYRPSPPSADVVYPAITYFLGSWDIAICADFILQGVLFAQIAHYTALYEGDALLLRAFVAGLALITTAKTAQGLVLFWTINVNHFMDVAAAIRFTGSSMSSVDVLLVAVIAFYVQMFFCARLWWISMNPYIVPLIVAIFAFALIALTMYTLADKSESVTWFTLHVGTALAGDVLLCGSTIYFLLRHSRHASQQTAGILSALMKLAVQSAAPAVVCALIAFVASVAWHLTTPGTNAYILLAIIANNVLPKAYAISAMWTLNSRKSIRRAYSIGPPSSSATSRYPTPDDLELSLLWISYEENDSDAESDDPRQRE